MRALLFSLSLFCGLALCAAPSVVVAADVPTKPDSTLRSEIEAAAEAGFDDGMDGLYENPPYDSKILNEAYDFGWHYGYILYLLRTGGSGD